MWGCSKYGGTYITLSHGNSEETIRMRHISYNDKEYWVEVPTDSSAYGGQTVNNVEDRFKQAKKMHFAIEQSKGARIDYIRISKSPRYEKYGIILCRVIGLNVKNKKNGDYEGRPLTIQEVYAFVKHTIDVDNATAFRVAAMVYNIAGSDYCYREIDELFRYGRLRPISCGKSKQLAFDFANL